MKRLIVVIVVSLMTVAGLLALKAEGTPVPFLPKAAAGVLLLGALWLLNASGVLLSQRQETKPYDIPTTATVVSGHDGELSVEAWGTTWRATLAGGSTAKPGEAVRVVGHDGLLLRVERM
jgi:membrane protein implicated in regulation of membrane protease activity